MKTVKRLYEPEGQCTQLNRCSSPATGIVMGTRQAGYYLCEECMLDIECRVCGVKPFENKEIEGIDLDKNNEYTCESCDSQLNKAEAYHHIRHPQKMGRVSVEVSFESLGAILRTKFYMKYKVTPYIAEKDGSTRILETDLGRAIIDSIVIHPTRRAATIVFAHPNFPETQEGMAPPHIEWRMTHDKEVQRELTQHMECKVCGTRHQYVCEYAELVEGSVADPVHLCDMCASMIGLTGEGSSGTCKKCESDKEVRQYIAVHNGVAYTDRVVTLCDTCSVELRIARSRPRK